MTDQEREYVYLVVHVTSGETQAVFKDEATAEAHVMRANERGNGEYVVERWPVVTDAPDTEVAG